MVRGRRVYRVISTFILDKKTDNCIYELLTSRSRKIVTSCDSYGEGA
jgi:hypothetical protein